VVKTIAIARRMCRLAGPVVVCVAAAGVILTASAPAEHAHRTFTSASAASQDYWLAPIGVPINRTLADAVADLGLGKAPRALSVFAAAIADPALGGYALLYLGRTQLVLARPQEAASAAKRIIATNPGGYLQEAALWLAADAADVLNDRDAADKALRALTVNGASTTPEKAWMRLAQIQSSTTERERMLAQVYFQYPLSAEADDASAELTKMGALTRFTALPYFAFNLGRAQQFFGARKYTDARKTFDALRTQATGDDRQLIDLRIAECDFYLRKFPAAIAGLNAYIDKAKTRIPEAQYFQLSAVRDAGRGGEYLSLVERFVATSIDQSLVEDALNDLGTYYILTSDDDKAAQVFRDLYRRFPTGEHAERAAWKSGWAAYRQGRYDDVIAVFESAATTLRRADFRPAWLYWAARAHGQRGEYPLAATEYRGVIADYRNSYYGRQAARELAALVAAGRAVNVTPRDAAASPSPAPPLITPGAPPPNAPLVRALLAAGLYDDAMLELKFTQRASGTSPIIEATIAYALNRKGELRPAITTMRRAYPQFIAEGGEALPTDILTVIFPVDHWDLITKAATAQKLDPYLMAALIAQESTFDADIRSSANAWGLMQVVPATGRQYARTLGIRGFTTLRLTNPETNLRIGMAYFKDLVQQFGDVVPALAAYNAGENRVVRWLGDRPGLSRDEFIDDIPFPETQNYVKRIVGTAEDYRRLYGGR
jgi:peptidoglycan lytic transglycosylase